MISKLTAKQLCALERLQKDGRSTPYRLGVSIGTLESLRGKGMVSVDRSQVGSIAQPRTRLLWDITEYGKLFMFHHGIKEKQE